MIDCTGRNSKTPEWFSEIGYDVPQDIRVSSFLGYSSRWYRIPSGMKPDALGIAIQPKPHAQFYRGAAVGVVEHDKVVVTLVGVNKDYPPTDEHGFCEFARSLDESVVFE